MLYSLWKYVLLLPFYKHFNYMYQLNNNYVIIKLKKKNIYIKILGK